MEESKQSTIRDAHFRHLNDYRDDPAYRGLQSYGDRERFFARRVGTRWEIDEAIFLEFLDLLPPLGYRSDSFYLSEFPFDDITHKFSQKDGRFYCEVAYFPPRPPQALANLTHEPRLK